MHLARKLILSCLFLLMAAPAMATPMFSFDIENAMGHNYYYLNFYVNQTLGNVFTVTGGDLVVTHLGVFDMNPDNEPYWDPNYPLYAENGFQNRHAVALFRRSDMARLAELIIPAGDVAPIQDEGYRYLPLNEPITLEAGGTYVLAAYWGAAGWQSGGMDTFYLIGTSPSEIPSDYSIYPGVNITDGCFNPNAGDGSTVDPPFIFNMFWGMYPGGANFLIEDAPSAVEESSWGRIKSMYR